MIRKELQHLAVAIKDLTPHPKNVRQGDIGAISESLKHHGQYRPIVVQQSTGHILAGNHTYKAAKALGWKQIAATYVDCDDEQATRILLMDNRANDLASYDDGALAEMLQSLMATNDQLAGTGFDPEELQRLLDDLSTPIGGLDQETEDHDVPLLDKVPSKTVAGDIWRLGPHRLMCGSSQSSTDVAALLDGAKINVAFTSPPYAEQRAYDETSGFKPISPDQYVEWFMPIAANVKHHLANDGSWFVNIKPAANGLDTELYVFDLVLAHVRQWGWHFATEFCWERSGMPQKAHRRFKNQFEPVYQFALDDWKFRPDSVKVESKAVPAYSKNNRWANELSMSQGIGEGSWEKVEEGLAFPGNRLQTFAQSHEITGHTAAFPVGLPQWFINAYTDIGDTIYDPFCGSGSTILAAHNTNRIGYGMEISPRYCDLICARYQKATGIKPIAEATGNEHDFLT